MAVQTRQQFRKKGGNQKRLRKSVARLTAMGLNPGLLVVLGRGSCLPQDRTLPDAEKQGQGSR